MGYTRRTYPLSHHNLFLMRKRLSNHFIYQGRRQKLSLHPLSWSKYRKHRLRLHRLSSRGMLTILHMRNNPFLL